MKLNSLHELFVRELQDMYDAESQLVKALPKLSERASYGELKNAISQHLEQTRGQVQRLEEVFDLLGEKARMVKCQGMRGIIDEGADMAEMDGEPAAIDAGIIGSAQKVEHYEIASYGSLCNYAQLMGHHDVLALLKQTLAEEKEADQKLTVLAESLINVDAVRAAGGRARQS
jgi:ferritin-like metal-binding protein YciE